MLILKGKVRQRSRVTFKAKDKSEKDRELLKLWIEDEGPGRDPGTSELAIREMLLDVSFEEMVPVDGSDVLLAVRAYPTGKTVGYQVVAVLPKLSVA